MRSLLVSGLVLGTVCALIGYCRALVDSSRAINVTSLALTLTAALLFGLCASCLAVDHLAQDTRASPICEKNEEKSCPRKSPTGCVAAVEQGRTEGVANESD